MIATTLSKHRGAPRRRPSHDGQVSDEFVEQPWVGFDYDFTFVCPAPCDRRIVVPAELYDRLTCGKAELPRCKCGAKVDGPELSPALRDVNDPALQDDVDHLIWYHTGTYRDWPDSEAYRTDVLAGIAQLAAPASVKRQELEQRMSLAVHVGTYESTIDNMMRRIGEEDPGGSAAPQISCTASGYVSRPATSPPASPMTSPTGSVGSA